MGEYNYLRIPDLPISDNPTEAQVFVRAMYYHLTVDHDMGHFDAMDALGIDDRQIDHLTGQRW